MAGLDGVKVEGGQVRLGAMVRQRVLERDPAIRTACPLAAEAALFIGHVSIRNRGTVGGSLAHADPAAELPAVAVALGAELELVSSRGAASYRRVTFSCCRSRRALPPTSFLSGSCPAASPRTGYAWLEVAERHGDFAIAGIAAAVTLDLAGSISAARLACAGVGPVPFDGSEAASMLVGESPAVELYAQVGEAAARACDPSGDLHGSSAYRRRLVRVLTERALRAAVQRAGSR